MEIRNHRMLEKALLILEYISEQPEGVTLPEICAHMQMAKSSAYSLLTTFVNMNYVKRGANSRFVIGMKPFEIGSRFIENSDFFLYSQDVLKELADTVSETAHLAALDGGDVVYLSKCGSTPVIQMSSSIGKRLPAHATALGKALLSGRSDDDVREIYRAGGMQPITPHTITEPERLLVQLREVRATGFAYECQESSLGIQCIAVPVKESSGGVYLGLSLSVPIGRSPSELEQMKQPLLEAKNRLERIL